MTFWRRYDDIAMNLGRNAQLIFRYRWAGLERSWRRYYPFGNANLQNQALASITGGLSKNIVLTV